MRFSRRPASVWCALVGVTLFVGCDRLSFMPQPKPKVAVGYDAVQTGMNEQQVVQLMGEPARRNGVTFEGMQEPGTTLTFMKGGHLMTVMLAGNLVVAKQKF